MRAEVKGMRKRVPGAVLMQKLGTRQPASRTQYELVLPRESMAMAPIRPAKEYHIITNISWQET